MFDSTPEAAPEARSFTCKIYDKGYYAFGFRIMYVVCRSLNPFYQRTSRHSHLVRRD